MRTASWVLLALLAGLVLVLSLVSATVAYRPEARDEFGVGGPTLADVAAWRPEVATAVRARRGTASAYAAGYAVLLLAVVLGPYRRGERWAFWAILAASLTLGLLTLARVPLLGTRLGAAAGGVVMGVTLLGLLLDVRRLRASP